jgi:hypothetical protein
VRRDGFLSGVLEACYLDRALSWFLVAVFWWALGVMFIAWIVTEIFALFLDPD